MKKWIHLACSLVLACCMGLGAFAAQPDLETRTDSLTVKCSTSDGEEETLLSGIGLSVAKVADVTCEYGNVTYTLTEDYAEANVSFEGISASESNAIAKKLAQIQDNKGYSGEKKVTGADGVVSFSGLEHGMYLVRQVSSTGMAKDYTTYEPFLVMVPEVGENSWVYEVNVYPKTTVKKVEKPTPPPEKPKNPKTPKNPPKKVKTGDGTEVMQWAMPLIGASIMIVAVMAMRRRGKEN